MEGVVPLLVLIIIFVVVAIGFYMVMCQLERIEKILMDKDDQEKTKYGKEEKTGRQAVGSHR